MVVVDAHCHAATFDYEPIESALDTMLRNGIEEALLIPLSEGINSLNAYLIACMRRFPGRFSVVATVDAHRPDTPKRLEEWATQGAEGVHLSPSDPLAIWHKTAELGLVVSFRRRVEDTASDDFRRTVESLPDLNIVIEQMRCRREDTPPLHMMYPRVLALAQYPNTFMKVPGLGEICQRPARFPPPSASFENIPPVIEMAAEYPQGVARSGKRATIRTAIPTEGHRPVTPVPRS